jgi:hypothetical protein
VRKLRLRIGATQIDCGIWDVGTANWKSLGKSVDVLKALMGPTGENDFARWIDWGARRFFCVVGRMIIK